MHFQSQQVICKVTESKDLRLTSPTIFKTLTPTLAFKISRILTLIPTLMGNSNIGIPYFLRHQLIKKFVSKKRSSFQISLKSHDF